MGREFKGYRARGSNSLSHTFGQGQVVAITGSQVGARLGDADNGLPRVEFFVGESVVEVPVSIQGNKITVVGVVEP